MIKKTSNINKRILNKKDSFKIINILPNPIGGGAEFLVRQSSETLKKKGFDVSSIYFNNPSNIKLKPYEHNLNIKNYKSPITIFYLRNTLKKLMENKKTIVHAHLTWPLYFLPFATKGLKTINIYTEHNTFNRRRNYPFLKPIERYIYSKYFKITCISEGTKKNLLKWLEKRIDLKKFIVIQNGSRLLKFVSRKKLNKKQLKLISIGSLSEQKGFDISIETIAKLKNNVKSYTILGEGDQKKNLVKLANKLKIKNKIILPGYVSNIENYLTKADIGMIPSKWEGFGLAAVEMLSTGLPLVCSNVSGLREVVKKCNSVKLVSPNDPQKFADTILDFTKYINAVGIKQISKEARKHSKKFNIDFMINNFANLYINSLKE